MAVAFTSANMRKSWQSSLLATGLWVAISIGIGHIVTMKNGYDEAWIVAAFVYGGFVLISILWWCSRAVVTWLVWRVIWRKTATNNLVAAFEKHAFPKPAANLHSPEAYFEDIVNDEAFSAEIRIAAGAHYLRIAEFARDQGLIAMFRTKATYEDAIAAFRATFPRADRL